MNQYKKREQTEESTFHGGFGKIQFLRMALYKVTYFRNNDKWDQVYRWLQSIYREVYPYFTEKEANDIAPLWKTATDEYKRIKPLGKVPTKLPGYCFDLELGLMKVMKAHRFDAGVINPQDYSGGAASPTYQQ